MEWAIYHFLSSAAFPHYNCRAEVGVQTVKPLLTNNTDPHGSLNINAFERAIIQYFITQDPSTKQSHVQSIFEQCIKDFIPIPPGHHYKPHPTTINLTQPATEEALRNRHMQEAERSAEHAKRLPPFVVGNSVQIQNQTGPHATRWVVTDMPCPLIGQANVPLTIRSS